MGNYFRDREDELSEHARYGGGPKVCEHQIEGTCVTCLVAENVRLQTEVERQEKLAQDKQKQQRYIAELIDSRFEAHQERRAAEAKLAEQKQIMDDANVEGLRAELEAAIFVINMDDPRLLPAAQLIVDLRERADAMEGRLSEIVEECEEVGEDPSYLFSMFYRDEESTT